MGNRIAFGNEQKRGDSHERGNKRKVFLVFEREEKHDDEKNADPPNQSLRKRKIFEKIFH